MRALTVLLKMAFMAASAIVVFGLLTPPIRGLDSRVPLSLPQWTSVAGVVLMSAGALLMVTCFGLFARSGALTAGAAFPDPPVFISSGPYRFVRNPMAKGLFTTLAGWGLYLNSPAFLLFTIAVALGMHLVVVYVEEPKLERRFGASYVAYREQVGRWLPRRRSRATRDVTQAGDRWPERRSTT